MHVVTKAIVVRSRPGMDIINVTEEVQSIIRKSKLKEGIANVFVPGSTASISTIEFEPNLVKDVKQAMERLVPSDIKYRHTETWGGGMDGLDRSDKAVMPHDNGVSHVRATLMGPSVTVPFRDGKMLLGAWQQVVCMDFDVPARQREIVVTLIGE